MPKWTASWQMRSPRFFFFCRQIWRAKCANLWLTNNNEFWKFTTQFGNSNLEKTVQILKKVCLLQFLINVLFSFSLFNNYFCRQKGYIGTHSKVGKVILLSWGYRFWFLLILWILRVHEIGAFMPNSSVFIFFDVVRPLQDDM